MQLAIWNEPSAEFIASGLTSGAVASPFEVVRADPAACAVMLASGKVDVALLPTLTVLREPDRFDVVPAVALSSWSYPFARLVLREGLGAAIRTLAFDPVHAQETLLAAIVLKEHYGVTPQMVPYPNTDRAALLASDDDARLLVGPDVPTMQIDALAMDLGQEWYELSNYPMVWGLFATRKGEMTPEMVHALKAMAEAAEAQRAVWIRAQETSPALHAFYHDDLRVRFDDLATASLTEFRQYLFFFKITEEVPELPVVYLSEEDDGEDDDRPLL